MLPVFYLVFLCSNLMLINAEGNGNLSIEVKKDVNCEVHSAGYTFTEGQNVTLVVQTVTYIDHGWWTVTTPTGSKELYDHLKGGEKKTQEENKFEPILYTRSVDSSMQGTWEFKFYLFKNIPNTNLPYIHHTDGANYSTSTCRTNVTIVPRKSEPVPSKFNENRLLIIACAVGAVLVAIIIAQSAYIVFLLRKARKLITLNTHNNLSKKSESIPNDRARYCSNPGQKIMKEPIPTEDDDNRDSAIYEAPNIEITSNTRMPMQPPQPPAITTMPRTPRSEHNMRIGPQAMLASALNSPARSPMSDTLPPNFQRPQHIEREINVANRPKLPLPNQVHPHHDAMFQEVYEEMDTEHYDDNTYEPPPVVNTMPPRLPMPPKKVPTGNLLDVKENTLKSRQLNKPAVTPKPQTQRPNNIMTANEFEQALRRRNENSLPRGNPGHMMHPQQQEQPLRRRPTGDAPTNELEQVLRKRNNGDAPTNELEEALRRRNNVMQVPIQSIPDPSSRSSPKPKPPPAMKPTAQLRHPVQEEIYYNEASDEEEWTYEPLKPLNSYDQNIYNV